MPTFSPMLQAVDARYPSADGPQPAIALSCGGDRALVALHGGHVLSWTPARGGERLYLSPTSRHGDGASIRGGIPVIFPQFADRGPLPRHGFVRTTAWRFDGVDDVGGMPAAVFALDDSAATRAQWPHAFALRLRVALACDALRLTLDVRNTGDAPFAFQCALHSYLQVETLSTTRLQGVQGQAYRDRSEPATLRRDDDASPAFGEEIDRIYVDAHSQRTLDDGLRVVRIDTTGFADTVVWNPGPALAAAMRDLAPGGQGRFVCVEPACIERAVTVAPGEAWRGTLTMTADVPARR